MPQTPYVTPKPSLGPDSEDKKALRAAEACTLVLLRRPVPTLALSQKSALVQGALGRGERGSVGAQTVGAAVTWLRTPCCQPLTAGGTMRLGGFFQAPTTQMTVIFNCLLT